MAHMIPVAEHFEAYRVSTDHGDELVPKDVCGDIDIDGEPTDEAWTRLLTYCEGTRIEGVEAEQGWYGRLSAPGYLDCTEWDGPYSSEQAALDAVKEEYGVDDNGEETFPE